MTMYGYASNFFETTNTIKKISGVYIPHKSAKILQKAAYFSYNALTLTTSLIYFTCELLILNETIVDLGKFIAHFGMLFTHIVGIGKFYILVFKRSQIGELCSTLEDPEYFYESLGDFQPAREFNWGKRVSRVVGLSLISVYTGVGVSAHISALFALHNSEFKEEHFDGNTTCFDFLPYFSYVPFSVETKTRCKMAFFFMDIPLDFLAWYIAALDCSFVTILNCLTTQLEILCGAFKTIRERCIKRLNLPENYQILHDQDNPEVEKELYAEIRHCTLHLMILLRVCEEMEKLFNLVTLAQTLASLLIFASCLFVATSVPMTSPIFFAQLEYFLAVLLQLSVYCWFGNQMSEASEAIRTAIYESNWLSSSKRFKVCMQLNMCRMQKPVYVSIGKFSPLALVTLVSVCRGSFSYFAVFKNVQ